VWCYIVKERTSIEEKTEENKKGVSSTFHWTTGLIAITHSYNVCHWNKTNDESIKKASRMRWSRLRTASTRTYRCKSGYASVRLPYPHSALWCGPGRKAPWTEVYVKYLQRGTEHSDTAWWSEGSHSGTQTQLLHRQETQVTRYHTCL
jgi:hypothetical protein